MRMMKKKGFSTRRVFVFGLLVLLLAMMPGLTGMRSAKAEDPGPVKTIRWQAKLRGNLTLDINGERITLRKGAKVMVVNRAFSKTGNNGRSTILINNEKIPVSNKYLSFIKDLCSVTETGDYTKEVKENFVNQRKGGAPSHTDFLVWICLDKQRVNIFTGPKTGGQWTLLYAFECSTGKAASPTTPHWDADISFKARKYKYFKNGGKLNYFSEVSGSGMHQWVGGKRGKLLGKHTASNGCIRLSAKNAQWVYREVPLRTRVIVW